MKYVYVLFCIGCFTISFNVAAITAAIPDISADLTLPDLKVAQIITVYMITYGLGALIYCPLTRFFSYKQVLVVTMILYGLCNFICATTRSLDILILGRIGMGISAASAIPVGLMFIGDFFERDVRGRLVGVFFSMAFAASIAGLAVLGFCHWSLIFYIPAILGVVLAFLFSLCKIDVLSKKHGGHINYLHALRNKEIVLVFSFVFVISLLYHGVHKWYGVYLDHIYGFDKLTISVLLIGTIFGGMIGQLAGGVLSDKKSRLFTCTVGIIGLSISVMLLAGIYSKIVLGIIMFCISLSWTIGHNGISTVLTDFGDEDRPMIASLNSGVRFISGGIGFLISGLFVEKNFGITFLIFGILMLLLAVTLKKVVPQTV